ncbi:hypothetical protein P0W64_09350 [Tsukamurella sp. 8F]|uniref:hypothetical protein n=1 Tax=unclassified Tsukamurella TaxID=2633480 RepID=UPI0023B9D373|nr:MULTISPECIES: hypothetical protein [unclassified Tsukamurella]MDF0529785.1 hypothetical protein [Tsukamurella sp. 8J]MDF0586977.1 hypothetical protein [Tsukamurella sp. 8F]
MTEVDDDGCIELKLTGATRLSRWYQVTSHSDGVIVLEPLLVFTRRTFDEAYSTLAESQSVAVSDTTERSRTSDAPSDEPSGPVDGDQAQPNHGSDSGGSAVVRGELMRTVRHLVSVFYPEAVSDDLVGLVTASLLDDASLDCWRWTADRGLLCNDSMRWRQTVLAFARGWIARGRNW